MPKVKPEEQIRRLALFAQRDARHHLRNLVRKDGDPALSEEANRPYRDVSTRTKVATILAGFDEAAQRAKSDTQVTNVVAPIFLFPQMPAKDWEQLATQVQATGALPPVEERPSIEAVVVEPKKETVP